MTRPLSLAALTVLELTPPDMVTCAAEAGFSHVGIRLLPATPTETQYELVGDTPLLREVLRRLADTGIEVLDVEIFRLKPDTRVADYEAAIATAARLGAKELLVAGHDPDEGRLTDAFGRFCDLADRYGLRVDLEFIPWTEAKDLRQAARIVERAGRTNGGVLIDPFHLSRSGSRIEDIDDPSVAPQLHAILRRARRDSADDGRDHRRGSRRAAPARRRRHRPGRPAARGAARPSAQRGSADEYARQDRGGRRARTTRTGGDEARARRLTRGVGYT
jgi:regulator of protease activity HflC (stomatin/prohibitin superfamily)